LISTGSEIIGGGETVTAPVLKRAQDDFLGGDLAVGDQFAQRISQILGRESDLPVPAQTLAERQIKAIMGRRLTTLPAPPCATHR
jgi:hypothetical protein